MLFRDVMALDVNNLSDARYFSAKGVRWMVFPVSRDLDNIQTIKEMLSWIAGPEPVLHSLDGDPDHARWIGKETDIKKVVVELSDLPRFEEFHAEDVIPVMTLEQKPPDREYPYTLVVMDSYDQYAPITNSDILVLPPKITIEVAQKDPGALLAVKGGEEEKPGLKNYETLDDIMSWLEEAG